MKIVINTCFGGFSLSYLGVKRLAELNGKECYAYKGGYNDLYHLIENPTNQLFQHYFSTNDVDLVNRIANSDGWHKWNNEQKDKHNKEYDKWSLNVSPEDRTDPKLIQVVEELGELANGSCAKVSVIDIPDGIEYYIDDYDGSETVREKHRSWS